jgi:AGZA family xanthine/uracil permease-like MFS transporter
MVKPKFINNFFRLKDRGSSIKNELYAGLILFLSSYILIKFTADILRDSFTPGELNLVYPILIIVIGITSGLLTILSGFLTNLPFAVVPNLIFSLMIAVTGHIYLGHQLEYVLVSAFIGSLLFVIVTIFFKKNNLLKLIPKSLSNSFALMLGLLLIFFGLINSGLITKTELPIPATTLGGVAPSISFTFPLSLGNILSPVSLLTLIGICLFVVLYMSKNKYSYIITFIIIAVLGFIIPINWSAGFSKGTVSGFVRFTPIENILRPEGFEILFSKLTSFKTFLNLQAFSKFWEIIRLSSTALLKLSFSFFIILFFSNLFFTSSLLGYGEDEADIEGSDKFSKLSKVNGLSALIGTLTNTTYYTYSSESAIPIINKGKTGLTAVFCGLLMLLFSLLFPYTNFFVSPAAISVILIVSGGLILKYALEKIDFDTIYEFIPAIIMVIMGFMCMNPALGLLLGFGTYTIINIFKLLSGKKTELNWFMYVSLIIMIIYFALNI